jgi:hypothetical protein
MEVERRKNRERSKGIKMEDNEKKRKKGKDLMRFFLRCQKLESITFFPSVV